MPVRVTINSADERLIPDLSAFAEVLTEKDDNALLAPAGAIHEKGGKTYVSVKTANGFEDREVELGIVNNTHASIVSGLKEGDEVRLD